MASEYWEDKRAGLKQALCAWAILLVLMAAFQLADMLSGSHTGLLPSRTATMQP